MSEKEANDFISFLNSVKETEKDVEQIEKIQNIIIYLQSMDISNGQAYLNELIKDYEIEKNLKYRQSQVNFNIYGRPITIFESFFQNCFAVIFAISKSILEDKVKDEFKNQSRSDFKSLVEIVEFYKNIMDKKKS